MMGRRLLALLLAGAAVPAFAQSTPDDTLSGSPPVTTPGAADTDQPAPKPPPTPTPTPPPPRWEAHGAATLQVLDKVDGRSATLDVAVGGRQSYRSLTIAVRACYGRPADQAPDATAFLVIADTTGTPAFTGWMLAAEPAASMMEHPIYDVRVVGCH